MASLKTKMHMLDIAGERLPLKLVKDPRARCMRLSMNAAGEHVRLTLPRWVSEKDGMQFVAERHKLIQRWWTGRPAPILLLPERTFLFRGSPHHIVHDPQEARSVRVSAGRISVGGPREHVPARLKAWLKAEARRQLSADVASLVEQFSLHVSSIRICDPRTRWASCASGGRLSFSWRLIMAPEHVRFYVVAHECAHLKHMNHSAAFWREVERLGGDLSCRSWFETQGAMLHQVR